MKATASPTAAERARRLVAALTDCPRCGAQDSHDVHVVNWYVLEQWIESVERRLHP